MLEPHAATGSDEDGTHRRRDTMKRAVGALRIGFVTDLHFGPVAYHDGKLRKLTHHAGELTRQVVRAMNEEIRPDLFVNLGDDIEDESRDADLARYEECQSILKTAHAELVNVPGNHDTIHLAR